MLTRDVSVETTTTARRAASGRLPRVALIRSRKAARTLERVFGDGRVEPHVQHVPLRRFGQLGEAVAAGREAARAALEDGGGEALVAALESPAAA
jgi:hypothetical protein